MVLLFAFFTAVQVPDANGVPVDTPSLVPYTNIYGLLALIGTAAILLVQAICSAAVIWYFWVQKTHPGNVITTLIAPLIGGVAMLYVVWLLWDNRAFAAWLCRQLAGVQGRPVRHPRRVRGRHCVCGVDAVRQAGGLRRDRAHRHGGVRTSAQSIVPRVEATGPGTPRVRGLLRVVAKTRVGGRLTLDC